MTDKLKQIIKEEAVKLPKEMQVVLNTSDWATISEEIGKRYFLVEGEITSFQTEIGLVLIGLTDQDLFVSNIENNVGLSKIDAEKITEEVNQKIFTPMTIKLNENIKKSLPIRRVHWQQNLNFILSGGDYTAFIRRVENQNAGQNISDMKKEFNPSKLDDLKSRFTI